MNPLPWLAAYAVATFLSFPHPVGGRVLDLGLVLSWIGPACLCVALRGLAPRRAAKLALFAGWAAHAMILHWIYVVTVVYGQAPWPVGIVAPIGLAFYMAIFYAVFGAGFAWLGRRGLASPPAVAALWTVLDHGRHTFLTGFPWGVLGYAQHENQALLGLAPWLGVTGLSFVTVLGGAALAEVGLAVRGGRRPGGVAFASLAAVALAHVVGFALPRLEPDRPAAAMVRIAVLQGNIDQGVKWSPAWAERILETYEGLAREAAGRGAQWIVWPETAVPSSVERDPALIERLEALSRETGAAMVVGGVGLDGEGDALRFYDSAFLLRTDGRVAERYDKSHLVPFGEYVPLRGLLGLFVSAVARGIARDDVTAGGRPRAIALDVPGGDAVPVGVPICYELLFPDLVRRFVGDGAGVLLAITNDAWYGRTGAPYQFLAITALRSAENRVWTARAANTGVSAFIDDRGRVVEETPIFERGLLVRDVPMMPPPAGGTFLTRHGDVSAAGCWIALAALGAIGVRRRSGDSGT